MNDWTSGCPPPFAQENRADAEWRAAEAEEALAAATAELRELRKEATDRRCAQWLDGASGMSTVLAAKAAASAAAMNQAGASYPGVSSELAEILRNVDPQALPAVLAQLQQATSGLNGGTDTGGGGQ